MYRKRDFDLRQNLPQNEQTLMQDLQLDTILNAMSDGDSFLFQVAKQALLTGLQEELETILYRQAVLKDCLRNYSIVKRIYDLTTELIEKKKEQWLGIFTHYPGSILSESIRFLNILIELFSRLRLIADDYSDQFESEGFTTFFAMIKAELTDEYFDHVKAHLKELEFNKGVLVSAELGAGNRGANYVLHSTPTGKLPWRWPDFLRKDDYTYHIDPSDLIGARALGELRDRVINPVAKVVAQSADHVSSFFNLLRTEIAFYLACVNLHVHLSDKGVPVCFPIPRPEGIHEYSCTGLRDVSFSLILDEVISNDLDADGKNLVIITGANQGGKSTFLRSIGMAQLMMQCGMFVVANSFRSNIFRGLFTHYRREEDVTMEHGKFEEELNRMSVIADAVTPNSLLLFNESFAATNEREGSAIAKQIIQALLETGAKIFFVTHLYEFAHGFWRDKLNEILFLRAERQKDGRRPFKISLGEPLQTSFGVDLYAKIFKNSDRIAGDDFN